jgi:hypothetical protein
LPIKGRSVSQTQRAEAKGKGGGRQGSAKVQLNSARTVS